ncbi:hypothetical protein [Devosia sp.]|uniref:hypothetical protein n=1 Tax=Devosia sp. TaxID=1871048 RepID=UPI003A8F59F3
MIVRLRKGVKRLELKRQPVHSPKPADRAWHEMLQRLDAEETERRLEAMETMLNSRH